MNNQNPLLPTLFSIILEQEARLDANEERLDDLKEILTARTDYEGEPNEQVE